MAKTNFYLKPFVNKQGEQLINLVFNYQNQRLVYSTAQTINKRDWNDAKTEQRARRSFKEYKSINDYLDELEVQVNAIYRRAKEKGKAVNNDYLRREMDAFLNKSDSEIKKNLYDHFLDFVDYKKKQSKRIGERTEIKYLNTYRKMKEAAAHYGIKNPTFEMIITEVFYNRYKDYWASQLKSDETTSKEVVTIKAFLMWAFKKKLFADEELKFLDAYKSFASEKPVHALSKEELFRLYNFDFTAKNNWKDILCGMTVYKRDNRQGKPKLSLLKHSNTWEEIRDIFCFCAFTGLRYSDYFRLEPVNVKGDTLQFVIFKTKVYHTISLNRYAKDILKKYKNNLPKYSNPFINRELKIIAQIAGLDSEIQRTMYINKTIVNKTVKLYDFIHHHMARKTFATVSLQLGMRQETVKEQGNWKRLETMKKYIKVSRQMIKAETDAAWSDEQIIKVV